MGHSRSQVNKQHKRKFSPKSSSRTLHRTSLQDSGGIGKRKSNNSKSAKNARRQRHKMAREQKRAAVLKEKRASGGSTSAPRLIESGELESEHLLQQEQNQQYITRPLHAE